MYSVLHVQYLCAALVYVQCVLWPYVERHQQALLENDGVPLLVSVMASSRVCSHTIMYIPTMCGVCVE